MTIYAIKKLIDGYKLGVEFAGKTLIAVPFDKSAEGNMIAYKNQMMKLEGEPLKTLSFPDKFGRGSYSLCYYEWKPQELWG